jgi:glucose-6-phosphate isomerase
MDESNRSPHQARKALADQLSTLEQQHLSDLFAADPERFARFSGSCGGVLVDYSKQRITPEILASLFDLGRACELDDWIAALFSGETVNSTEQRPAMHWRLRQPDTAPEVAEQLEHMAGMVNQVLAGQWRGVQGDAITDVVNVGVGGSDLGPLMAAHALHDHVPEAGERPRLHFVSAMDGSHIAPLLDTLDPGRTLVIVSSKSFATVDTMTNARTARLWLTDAFPGKEEAILRCHFLGVSARADRMSEWGIPPFNQLEFWDWVGGRFSLWSAIGLPIALAVGMAGFRRLLEGAREMDEHFRYTRLEENLPVIIGLIDVWNVNFLDIRARAVLPYDGRLKHFPTYLEQLEMESNGKSVNRAGEPIDYHTCPVIWGDVGSNAQHAFFQLLHQGTQPVACDFVVSAEAGRRSLDNARLEHLEEQHHINLANCLGQSRLLAFGQRVVAGQEQLPSFKQYHGNQPSTTLLLEELSPRTLGALIALYEHKVFVQSVLWGINPFDQWGVELGKQVATELADVLDGSRGPDALDCSTAELVRRVQKTRSSNRNGSGKE